MTRAPVDAGSSVSYHAPQGVGALHLLGTHPSDSSTNERCDRWPEWRRRPAGPAPDDVDRQDEAAGDQARAKLSVAGPTDSVAPNLRRGNSSDPYGEWNFSRGCKFRKRSAA